MRLILWLFASTPLYGCQGSYTEMQYGPSVVTSPTADGKFHTLQFDEWKGSGTRGGLSGPTLRWLTFTPDGKRIVSTGFRLVPRENLKKKYSVKNVNIAEIRVWDAVTGRQLQDHSGEEVGNSFGFTGLAPDGETLAMANMMGSLRLPRPASSGLSWNCRESKREPSSDSRRTVRQLPWPT